jgi:hypothetical protein
MRISLAKQRQKRRGSSLMEFALIAPFMVITLAGSFSIGMGMNRAVQARQAVRNANVLFVKNFDLSIPDNQRLIVRTASGLGMDLPAPAVPHTPNPTGRATIILTRVKRVGAATCNLGIPNWDQQPSSCTNYGHYVIERRIVLGNLTRWTSPTGTPSSPLDPQGWVSQAARATQSGNRASGFPGMLALELEEVTYLAEMFVDTDDISMFPIINPVSIYVRNFS